jgi:hypothetical protein
MHHWCAHCVCLPYREEGKIPMGVSLLALQECLQQERSLWGQLAAHRYRTGSVC